jgi:gluconokinase
VLHHLTGRMVTELSSASATGLLDLATRRWHSMALELAHVSASQLPEILPSTAVLTMSAGTADRLGVPRGLPVAVGAADGPLGNLGTGAIRPGVAGLSLGTSGAIRMAVPQPSFDDEGRLFCYALTEDVWVVGGAISNGGITLRWAGETFAPDLVGGGSADGAVLDLAAEAPAGSAGLLMLPYVLSERAPLWDPTLSGAFLGIRAHHTRHHFIRAALEGVCLQLSTILDSLNTVTEVRSVRGTGRPFSSALWRDVMAATLGRPFSVSNDAGGTAMGAAALGWFALKGAGNLADSLIAVGGPDPDADPPVVPVTSAALAEYAALRGEVRRLIHGYLDVADLFPAVQDPPSG